MIRVLMIEDDPEMAEILKEYLAGFDIQVTNYTDPHSGLSALACQPYDLAILDLSLPEMDGLEVCRQVRTISAIPLIISSARSDIGDKAACFTLGADDYLPKPYESRELVLRIHSLLRRCRPEPQNEQPSSPFQLDRDGMRVTYRDEPLALTRAEFGVLAYMIERKNAVVSRVDLLMGVEAINDESGLKSIDVIINRLRQKIEPDPKNPTHILAIRGVGYKLVDE